MKSLFENWRRYLCEEDTQVIDNKKELISYIKNNPSEKINIDFKKGSKKGFGGLKQPLPFDYGEWPNLINPADSMGWDFIIVPSSNKEDDNLMPVGHVDYDPELKPDKLGNDKIIIAADSNYSEKDKEIINSFFNKIEHFKNVEWLK